MKPPSAHQRGGAYRAPLPRAGDVRSPKAAPPAPRRAQRTEDPGRAQRQRVREEYQRSLRELRGEPEPKAPQRYVVPPVKTCCALARLDPSGCTCGGTIYCPTHWPNGTCSMQFSHD